MKTMKVFKLIIAAMTLIMPFLSLAKTETVNGIRWTYTVTNGKASIGNGTSSAVSSSLESSSITVPSELGGYPVTSIGANAFKECQNLWRVTIPDTVTSIGSNAFYYCTNLRSMTIPSAVTSIGYHAFGFCNKMTDITLSASLVTIEDSAFFYCDSLSRIAIPASVTSIGKFAFLGCDSLKRVDVTDLAAWCRISFGDDTAANPLYYAHNLYLNGTLIRELIIPSSITSVKNYAFSGWGWNDDGIDRPVSVIIPDSVQSIGTSAFERCSGLARVTIGNGVKSIGNSSFYHCDRLSNIVLPDSVTSIGKYAFDYCTNLTSITIPESVTQIGKLSFSSCSRITNVTMKGDCPIIGASAFHGVAWNCKASLPNGNTTYTVTNGTWQEMPVRYYNGLYAVTFDANEGKGGTSRTLEYGATIVAPTVTRDGYVFNGWSPNVAATVPASNVTYKAQWKARQYTVTFDANGGAGGTSNLMDCGSSITAPIVMRPGYAFAGWSPAVVSTVPANDVTYTAQWAANSYTIAYDANGGTGITVPTAAIYDQDAILSTNGFTRYAKQFAGWTTEADGDVVYNAGQTVSNLTTEANGTVTLFAVWEPLIVSTAEVSAADGTTFCGDSYTVTLSCPLDGAKIYYTTNGVTPRTSAAFAYTDPFTIYGSANIVAVAVKDGVKSDYTRVSIAQIAPEAPVISPADGTEFRSETCEVTISCMTDGSEIYYTLDGSTPQKESATKYTVPFTITDTTTVKAIAVGGPLKSEVVTATLVRRSLSLAEAAGNIELSFTTDETAPWLPIVDSSAESGFAAQSGTIGITASTWMEASVNGAGVFSFRWRVECEKDDSGQATWDRLMVYTNGVEAARIDGITEWSNVISFGFDDDGVHIIRWEFLKDDYDEDGIVFSDHGWVSGVTWIPAGGSDPLPPLDAAATDNDAKAIIGGLSDARLSNKVVGTAAYIAFRNWVDSKGLSHALVKDAPNAWLSYALDAPGLMTKTAALANEDVVIESITPSSAATGTFDLVVDIAGAEIGTAARLAEVLGVEGATELNESAFSSEGLNVTLERTADGKVKAVVTPQGSPAAFFVRVKVR